MNLLGFVCNAGSARVRVTCSSGDVRRTETRSRVSRQKFNPRVYLVTDRKVSAGRTVEEVVRDAIRGSGRRRGVTFVQLRDKHVQWEESLKLGRKLREITREFEVGFVVNDDVKLAFELGADGVHVGQEDCSVKEARSVLGEDAIIGVSAGTIEEAETAIKDGADYIGVGAVFATGTKSDAGKPIGPKGLGNIVAAVKDRIAVVAIGGISTDNVDECWRVGANGVAVVSAIMQSERPDSVAEQLQTSYEKHVTGKMV